MYYSPPKSSCWGHSLRKMKPEVVRERLATFLARAASGVSYATGSIFLQPGFGSPISRTDFEAHFTTLLGLDQAQPRFSNLTEAEFELCYLELLKRPDLYELGHSGVTLIGMFTIESWRIGARDVATESLLGLYLGARPIIVPRFQFETMEIFEYLRNAMLDAKICRLDPRHIKGRGRDR